MSLLECLCYLEVLEMGTQCCRGQKNQTLFDLDTADLQSPVYLWTEMASSNWRWFLNIWVWSGSKWGDLCVEPLLRPRYWSSLFEPSATSDRQYTKDHISLSPLLQSIESLLDIAFSPFLSLTLSFFERCAWLHSSPVLYVILLSSLTQMVFKSMQNARRW